MEVSHACQPKKAKVYSLKLNVDYNEDRHIWLFTQIKDEYFRLFTCHFFLFSSKYNMTHDICQSVAHFATSPCKKMSYFARIFKSRISTWLIFPKRLPGQRNTYCGFYPFFGFIMSFFLAIVIIFSVGEDCESSVVVSATVTSRWYHLYAKISSVADI